MCRFDDVLDTFRIWAVAWGGRAPVALLFHFFFCSCTVEQDRGHPYQEVVTSYLESRTIPGSTFNTSYLESRMLDTTG